MYLIPIAWIYVALMMSVAEATATNGTVIGAVFTFLLYGVLPVSLLVYLLGTPSRKRSIRAREMQERERAAAKSAQAPDASGHATADPVAPVGKEP